MSTQESTLGRCPDCDESIPRGQLLIAYETDDGSDAFAECPACREVVHPV